MKRVTLQNINLEFTQEETGDVDKGRTDIIPEIGLIAETGVPIVITTEIEETIKTRTIMVLEIIEIGAEISRIIDPIIEGKILAKGMTKHLDIEVSVENETDPDPGIGVPQEKTLKIDIETIKVEVGKGKGPEPLPQKEAQGQGQDPGPTSVLTETG